LLAKEDIATVSGHLGEILKSKEAIMGTIQNWGHIPNFPILFFIFSLHFSLSQAQRILRHYCINVKLKIGDVSLFSMLRNF
jgi:hypothetical protein